MKIKCALLAAFIAVSGLTVETARTEAGEYGSFMNVYSTRVEGKKTRAIPVEQREKVFFALNGRQYYLQPETEDGIKGSVELADSEEGESLFSVELDSMGPWFKAGRLILDNGREFLVLMSGASSVSDGLLRDFWLLDLQDGEPVIYVTKEDLREAGLMGYTVRVDETLPREGLWIEGVARDRDCTVWKDGKVTGYSYKGYPVTRSDSAYWGINAVSLDWNEETQSFDLEYHDNPKPE